MAFLSNLEDIKGLCRICLNSSENMISLDNKLDDKLDDSPLIVDVLQNILLVKVDDKIDYPVEICHMCRRNLIILYDLKVLFNKSQNILKKYVSSLQQLDTMNPLYNSDMLTLSTNRNNDLISDGTSHTDIDDIKTQDLNKPKKSVKLQIDTKKQNSVKVKWLEGNRFIIERKEKNVSASNNKCRYCHKVLLSNEKLSSHLNVCKKKSINCKYCKDKFYSERTLRSHLRLLHGFNPPLEIKCEICDETFKTRNARSYHKITRHNIEGKKHTCEICGKAFYFRNSLNQHLECHSRDVSRVICPICGKSFHYRGGLFYHMKIHRNERNYICTFCNGRFLNMASLKRHTRIHTGERPYTCSFCPKTFCSVSEVRTHERRHTGQKPHQCQYCKKRFITPYNLKLHISSHSGSQPCEICGKSYLNEEALKYHIEMKHHIKDQTSEEL